MKKIIVMLMVSVLSLLVFGCTASQTTSPDGVDLPQPAGSDSALAGQGYAAGTYDHTYQLYNNFRPDGSMVSYLVENGNWVYLGDLRLGSRVHQSNLDLEVIGVSTDPQYPGAAIRLSTECREYSINFDNLGQYTITPDGHNPDIFSVPLSLPQPIRQIAGTDDAITIHSTSSSVAWFTLHCDEVAPVSCTNGAINPPACNACSTGQILSNGQCVVPCANGAINPPVCNTCSAGQVLSNSSNGQCATPSATTTTARLYQFNVSVVDEYPRDNFIDRRIITLNGERSPPLSGGIPHTYSDGSVVWFEGYGIYGNFSTNSVGSVNTTISFTNPNCVGLSNRGDLYFNSGYMVTNGIEREGNLIEKIRYLNRAGQSIVLPHINFTSRGSRGFISSNFLSRDFHFDVICT